MITSILQTDLYKLSMQQLVFHQYPNAKVEYVFKCRNKDVQLGFLAGVVQENIRSMAALKLKFDEEVFLRENVPFFKNDYFEFLRDYRFNPDQVSVCNEIGELEITIRGPWVEAILWEVPLLAIVNEAYFAATTKFEELEGEGLRRLHDKIDLLQGNPTFTMAEFGTRRRYSAAWQKEVMGILTALCPQVVGTSNVRLAMEHGIKPIGTMAHEYFSAHLALVDNFRVAQKRALHVWLQEYGTDLGIALTDTFTTKAFFDDFDLVLAREFSGVRHDSGDPMAFGESVIAHYEGLGIDPRTKTIVFSDGLDIKSALSIFRRFTGRVGISFGIGTSITNDLGVKPLNIVIKLVSCNGQPVVKLSDNVTKAIGDKTVIRAVQDAYGLV